MTKNYTEEIFELKKELAALRLVADAAAQSCIDLSSNLSSAYQEYMDGKLSLSLWVLMSIACRVIATCC